MPIATYGHYGFALLLIPTAAADFLEYERFLMLDSIRQFVDEGKLKVYSVDSINNESWMNNNMNPRHKSIRHNQYNDYIYNEVVPFIFNDSNGRVPIITCGASLGALHGANLFFKRPDLIEGTIAMSGVYDLSTYTKGHWDDDCYFNSPAHYLPNLNDQYYLPLLRSKRHIHILTGQGSYEDPSASVRLSDILKSKGIPHELDLWGHDMPHDWTTWRDMLPLYLSTRF